MDSEAAVSVRQTCRCELTAVATPRRITPLPRGTGIRMPSPPTTRCAEPVPAGLPEVTGDMRCPTVPARAPQGDAMLTLLRQCCDPSTAGSPDASRFRTPIQLHDERVSRDIDVVETVLLAGVRCPCSALRALRHRPTILGWSMQGQRSREGQAHRAGQWRRGIPFGRNPGPTRARSWPNVTDSSAPCCSPSTRTEPSIPTRTDNIPGLEALQSADLMVISTRFRNLPDDQMKQIVDYVESGQPIIGLRTATHAFQLPENSTYARYSWQSKTGTAASAGRCSARPGSITMDNHGVESTRGHRRPGMQDHPILRGIQDGDIYGPTDVYTVTLPLPGDSQPLVLGQVLVGMDPKDKPVAGAKNDPMMPVAWLKTYTGSSGKTAGLDARPGPPAGIAQVLLLPRLSSVGGPPIPGHLECTHPHAAAVPSRSIFLGHIIQTILPKGNSPALFDHPGIEIESRT